MANIANINGRAGQIADMTSAPNEDLLKKGGLVSQVVPEEHVSVIWKLGIVGPAGTYFNLNNNPRAMKIPATGIYELDSTVLIRHLSFQDGLTDEITIDFVY